MKLHSFRVYGSLSIRNKYSGAYKDKGDQQNKTDLISFVQKNRRENNPEDRIRERIDRNIGNMIVF